MIMVSVGRAALFVIGIEIVTGMGQIVALPIEHIPVVTTLALAVTAPALKATYPRAVLGGHLISYGLALFCHTSSTPPVVVSAVALVLMQIAGSLHPPAALTPFLIAAHPEFARPVALPLFFGCLVAAAVSALLRRFSG